MNDDIGQSNRDHDLLEIEALLRSLTADDLVTPEAPPAPVWAGIEAELTRTGDITPRRSSAASIYGAPTTPSPVRSLDEHRSRRSVGGRPLLAAAAAVTLLVAGAIAVVATRGNSPEVVATAQLAWDPEEFDPLGENASARAELVERNGGYEIVLTDAALTESVEQGADLELWLISLDSDGAPADVQPVALVDAGSPGTYAVPAELDPDTYTVVDISIEPRDGDEAHSGRSILRGELTA